MSNAITGAVLIRQAMMNAMKNTITVLMILDLGDR